jgi:hypothetical protein
MILATHSLPASVKKTGEDGGLVILAGRRLTIETSPGGAEILDETVPAGKRWTVTISVSIDETDA